MGAIGFGDFLIFGNSFGKDVSTPGGGSTIVAIPDANLRAVIEDSLGKASGAPITQEEMVSLTRLEAPNSNISDLAGLEFATDLTYLRLYNNLISDIAPLSGLTSLEWLHLGSNSITDVSPLSSLTNLKTLYLYATLISDISALSSLTNLEFLDLLGSRIVVDNRISDISALSSLTNLKWLRISRYDDITDFSALSSLTNLTELFLSEVSITDVSPLSSLTNLSSLDLSNNSITDVSPLSSLTNLSSLDLSNNSITDVSPLSSLTNLKWLRLFNNNITDLAPLVANRGLGADDEMHVRGNPLNATSINVHVPALQAKGVSVSFDETIVFTDLQIYNDNVVVLPVSEDLAVGNLPLDKYATRFYEYFSDAFDFLIFIPSLYWSQLDLEAFQGAFYSGVRNDVQGIGKEIFFNEGWGAAGKLQGGIFFASISGLNSEHSRLVEGPMLHELMHRWANFIVSPLVHWDFSSANGILGGFDAATLVDHGGGRYSAPNVSTGGWALNIKRYSPIELYLAGLIPPEEVPDLWVAEDGEILRDESGRWDRKSFTASRVKTYTIEDIIAEHGPRIPDHRQSQKAFRAAVILLVSEDYPATSKFLEMLNNNASLFSHAGEDQFDEWYNFYEATGGRATITLDGLSQFENRGATKRPALRSFGTPSLSIVCHCH